MNKDQKFFVLIVVCLAISTICGILWGYDCGYKDAKNNLKYGNTWIFKNK